MPCENFPIFREGCMNAAAGQRGPPAEKNGGRENPDLACAAPRFVPAPLNAGVNAPVSARAAQDGLLSCVTARPDEYRAPVGAGVNLNRLALLYAAVIRFNLVRPSR